LSFIAFVAVWPEVSLVLLTFDEVLFVVYVLSRPELQPQCFGFSTALFTFAAVLPMLVADFVKN
jgi:Na+/melibiose symporter-like transporter